MHRIPNCWLLCRVPAIIRAGAPDRISRAGRRRPVGGNKCVHDECVHSHWCYLCSSTLLCVFLCAQEIRAQTEPPACRGRNVFLQVYISADICLMSSRVERCIEHVRRPLAARWGWQIASHSVTAHSVSLLASFISSIPLPIINEI